MLIVLRAFEFWPDICQWISTFYKGIMSTVAVNGQLSQWFLVQRGVDKGTQYRHIYSCVEIFATMIRQDENTKVFPSEKLNIKAHNTQMIPKLYWKVTKIHLKQL